MNPFYHTKLWSFWVTDSHRLQKSYQSDKLSADKLGHVRPSPCFDAIIHAISDFKIFIGYKMTILGQGRGWTFNLISKTEDSIKVISKW